MNDLICIGCGCDEAHACDPRCHWLTVDHALGAGVCSRCPDHLERWWGLDRTFSVAALQNQATIAFEEEEGWIEIQEEEDAQAAPEPPRLILPGDPGFRW